MLLELAAQGRHIGLDEIRVVRVIAPHLGEDLRLGDHPAALAGKVAEQSQLGRGHGDARPTAQNLTRILIDDDIGHLDGRRSEPASAAQHGSHPSNEFGRYERLDHVVVGTDLEAVEPVGDPVAGGHEHDAGLRVPAQMFGQSEAGRGWKHHVQDRDVRPEGGDLGGKLGPVRVRGHRQTCVPQRFADSSTQDGLVLNDQYPGRVIRHGSIVRCVPVEILKSPVDSAGLQPVGEVSSRAGLSRGRRSAHMALQFTRRTRIAVIGAAAAVVVAGGTGVAIAAASGPGSSTPTAAPPSSGSSAPAQPPARASISPISPGTVTSVRGNEILIKDFDGFTRTIKTSSKTTYRDGLTANPAVGTQIVAAGSVDADGTSLDATSIGKGFEFGHGERGGFWHHGPGRGFGPRPPSGSPPNGAPSAPSGGSSAPSGGSGAPSDGSSAQPSEPSEPSSGPSDSGS